MKHARLLLFTALAATLPACFQQGGSRTEGNRTIVVRSPQEPDGLNPFLSGMSAATDASMPIFSGLLSVDENLHFVPDLALEIPTPENGGVAKEGKGMVVTYHLRKGVRWHDGKPFTAKDVVFTQKVLTDRNVLVVERQGHDLVDHIDTPDPYTVKVHFKEVYAPYLQLFKTILPEHLLANEDINHAKFNHEPVGTGPFKFKAWRAGDRLVYTANKDYFRGAPAFDQLEFKFIPDDNAAFVQLKNRVIDVYQTVNLSQYRSLQKLPGVKIYATPALLWEHLSFNTEKPIFKDVRVRQAIAFAIDKNVLSEKVYDGVYKPAWCDQNPRSWAYSPDLVGDTAYNPDKARKLLDDAGWKPGADGIRVNKDGERFSVAFSTTAGKKNRETAQLLIRHFLKQVGIEVRIANYPGVNLFGAYPNGIIKSGKFDMAMWAWETGPDPDNVNSWDSHRVPPYGSNQTRYRNPEMDTILEAATRTFVQSERQTLYRKASHILARDLPNIPLLYWTVLDAATTRLVNFRPNPSSQGNLWNVYEWRLKNEDGN